MIINGHPRIWPCYECGERKQIDHMTLMPTGERENRVDYVCDDCKISATRKHYADQLRQSETLKAGKKHPFAGTVMKFHPECMTVNEESETLKADELKVDVDGMIEGAFSYD